MKSYAWKSWDTALQRLWKTLSCKVRIIDFSQVIKKSLSLTSDNTQHEIKYGRRVRNLMLWSSTVFQRYFAAFEIPTLKSILKSEFWELSPSLSCNV